MNEEKLRKKYIEAARKAPAVVFSDGVRGMTAEQVRAKIIEYYEDCGEIDLLGSEQEIEDWDDMIDDDMVMNISMRGCALNLSLISEAAVMAEYYNFLNEIQKTKNIEVDDEYSSITDWMITIYDRDNNDIIAQFQEGNKGTAFLIAHGALLTWLRQQDKGGKENEKYL